MARARDRLTIRLLQVLMMLAAVASAAAGGQAYVGNFKDNTVSVIDTATNRVTRTIDVGKPPRDPEFGADGRALYFTLAGIDAVQVLDPASDKTVAQIPTGASPHIAALFRNASIGTVVVQGPGELLLDYVCAVYPYTTGKVIVQSP
jgi:YVTN family beta-propeller protein